MNKHIKSKIIVLLSLVIAVCGGLGLSNIIKGKENNADKTVKDHSGGYNSLSESKDWKKVNEYWKKLNHAEDAQDYDKIYKVLEKIVNEENGVEKNLEKLVKENLITAEEKENISIILQMRLGHMRRMYMGPTCYQMTIEGGKVYNSKDELEKQFDLLEKNYKENKINHNTYKSSYDKIQKELKFIKEKGFGNYENLIINDNLIETIINLNK